MDKWLEGLEPIVEHQELKVPYRYSMGATASKFFNEIRDNCKIMGLRCSKCEVVYVPPRSTCGRCFSPLNDWVEVSDQGTLETYTRVRYETPVQPVAAPFFYGIIKLDGADTGLPHLIGDANGKELRIGMRVQAVFKEERVGNLLDILYFKPMGEEKEERRKIQGPRPEARGRKAQRGKGEKGKGPKVPLRKTKEAKGKAKRPRAKSQKAGKKKGKRESI